MNVSRDPPVYRLKDYDGKILQGTFYEQEMQKGIIDRNKTFKIEMILSRKKRQGWDIIAVRHVYLHSLRHIHNRQV